MAKFRFKATVKDVDKGYQRIMKELRKMTGTRRPHVKVGIQGKSALDRKTSVDDDGIERTDLGAPTVVDVATFHEFGGDPGPPERSFLRATMDANKDKYFRAAMQLRDQIFQGKMTTERALGILGLMIVRDVKKRIRDGINPPLAESTIRWKNRRQLAQAESRLSKMESIYKAKGRLTRQQKATLNRDAELLMTGGKSTPLIDTAQMINSIHHEVDMGMASSGGRIV